MRSALTGILVTAVFVSLTPAFAAGDGDGDETEANELRLRYATPEERRQAGHEHKLTDWLTVESLVELEAAWERFSSTEDLEASDRDDYSVAMQGGAELEMTDWAKLEAVIEYDSSEDDFFTDEAFAAFEHNDFELNAGRLYLPFGVFYSRFVSGPFLEFGETRDHGVVLSYGKDTDLELGIFVYRGLARELGDGQRIDWGAEAGVAVCNLWRLGVSFISDLADSDEGLLDDSHHRYRRKVPGLNAYAVMSAEDLEITIEVLGALRSFVELDDEIDTPIAWNTEAAMFIDEVQLALRAEGSKELPDAARFRAGIAVSFPLCPYAILTVEALDGWYNAGILDDRDRTRLQELGAQLSLEF